MKKIPKSLGKYIRGEKSRIRREVFDLAEQQKQIGELYRRLGYERFVGANTKQV